MTNNKPSPSHLKKAVQSVKPDNAPRCFDVYLYTDETFYFRTERYDLYTQTDDWYNRFNDAATAKHWHRVAQKTWLVDDYTRHYEELGVIYQFQFDATEEEYKKIAITNKWWKVKFNE